MASLEAKVTQQTSEAQRMRESNEESLEEVRTSVALQEEALSASKEALLKLHEVLLQNCQQF